MKILVITVACSCSLSDADRKAIPAHLPLAWTHSSAQEVESFMTQLEELARPIQSPIQNPEPNSSSSPVESALPEIV